MPPNECQDPYVVHGIYALGDACDEDIDGDGTLNGADCQPEDPAAATPDCTGKTCGADGCGGVCGICPLFNTCNAAGQCEPTATNDPTTVIGTVIFGGGTPAVGVTVARGAQSVVTDATGGFLLSGVNANTEVVLLVTGTDGNEQFQEYFGPYIPVAGGTTDVGTLVLDVLDGSGIAAAIVARPVSALGTGLYDAGFDGLEANAVVASPTPVLTTEIYDPAFDCEVVAASTARPVPVLTTEVYDPGFVGEVDTAAAVARPVPVLTTAVYDPGFAGLVDTAAAVARPVPVLTTEIYDASLDGADAAAVIARPVPVLTTQLYAPAFEGDAPNAAAVARPVAVVTTEIYDPGFADSAANAVVAAPVVVLTLPLVSSVTPVLISVLDGTALVTVTGENLDTVTAVQLYRGATVDTDITANNLNLAGDGTSLTFTVSIDPTAMLGTWTVVLVANNGTSATNADDDNTFELTE